MIIAIVIPLFCMLSLSLALIKFVVFNRKKFLRKLSQNDAKKFVHDVKLAASIVGLDIMFALTQLPGTIFQEVIYNYLEYSTLFLVLEAIYFLFFGLDFFVYFLTNSIFREELKLVLHLNNQIVKNKKKNVSTIATS